MVEPFLPSTPYAVSLDSFSATGIRNEAMITAVYGTGQLDRRAVDLRLVRGGPACAARAAKAERRRRRRARGAVGAALDFLNTAEFGNTRSPLSASPSA